MKIFYDQVYLDNALWELHQLINNLEEWSVYNDDKINEEVHELNEFYKKLLEKTEL